MTIEVIEESIMTPAVDATIRQVLCECFPHDAATFAVTRAWHGSAPFLTAVARDEHTAIAGHAGLHDRAIDVGGAAVHVAGLQNVCIIPQHRKTGLLGRLLQATMREAATRDYDVGLLFCLPVLRGVYARLGWHDLPGRTVTRVDESGTDTALPNADIAMFYPLKLDALPAGNIHLRGNDW